MNDIAIRPATGFGLINREDLQKSLSNAAMSMPVGGDKAYLKMDKGSGEWVYGQEETVVEPDSLWAVNPTSIKHGWVAWDTNAGGAPVQEIMVPISRPLPAQDALPALPMGTPDRKTGRSEQLVYQRQQAIDLVCISGEDEGVQVEYKQSSVGAMKLFASVTNALLDQLGKDPDRIVPVGKLTADQYKHKQYGKIYNPIFQITEWRTIDDTSPADEPDDEPAAATPAATPRTRTVAPAPAPEKDDLDAEYAAEQAAQADAATPRRRMRR